MIKMTWIPHVLQALAWGYLAAFFLLLAVAMIRPDGLRRKAMWVAATIAAFSILPLAMYLAVRSEEGHLSLARDKHSTGLTNSLALFDRRCKSAGITIRRTVEAVDRVVWMRWRPQEINHADQFMLNDPYGHDCHGDECIKRLLRVTQGAELSPEIAERHATGYRFVETTDPRDGNRYRYRGVVGVVARRTFDEVEQYKANNAGKDPGVEVYGFVLERQMVAHFSAQYGVLWADLSTAEDRAMWIAGSSLKVVDIRTGDVLAERIGYMLDSGLGNHSDSRSPWLLAQRAACPPITSDQTTWAFAMKVVKPSKRGE